MGSYSRPPKLLFVDAFDSFTNNVVGLLEKSIGAEVTVKRINDTKFGNALESNLATFDGVVVGPGPGDPAKPEDVGFINRLWNLPEDVTLPVLGVCLGHQSMCLNNGASVIRMSEPRHGLVNHVVHCGDDIFQDVGTLAATRYHSFHVDLGSSEGGMFWDPTAKCLKLRPLAWGPEDRGRPTLEAVRHTEKPFWAVQFHPESICTSRTGAERIVANWWALACDWNESHGRKVQSSRWEEETNGFNSHSSTSDIEAKHVGLVADMLSITGYSKSHTQTTLSWETVAADKLTPDALCEALMPQVDDIEVVLLDSQGHKGERGRFSILGLLEPQNTLKVTYSVDTHRVSWGTDLKMESCQLDSIDQVWPILQRVLDAHYPTRGQQGAGKAELPTDIPFWGGFTGYISYEAGLETIDVDVYRPSEIPDINFAFIQRSIIIDHEKDLVHVQSLLPNDSRWVSDMAQILAQLDDARRCSATSEEDVTLLMDVLKRGTVRKPTEQSYRGNVLKCQEFLRSGDSYELCLTDQTEIQLPASELENPAPFGAFIRLNGVTVVGSSPERFLSWDRTGLCQFRPIKGTVKKSDFSREEAYDILGSSKERAENLMIVDLIRHDVGGVVGASNTWVSKLMVVEEYATVYQLVSVIEAQCPPPATGSARGLDVLQASLPPGSMTGAPKKRSCEILRDMEPGNRGLYAGVLGYLDVGGSGDFSVVIRTAVSLSDKNKKAVVASSNGLSNGNGAVANGCAGSDDLYTYRIGAGGAVTIQSTDKGEFEEMETKLSSVLRAFTA